MNNVSVISNNFYLSKFVLEGAATVDSVTISDFKFKGKFGAVTRFLTVIRSRCLSKKERTDEILIFFAIEDMLALHHYSKNSRAITKKLWLWNPIVSMSVKRRFFLLWYCKVNRIEVWTFDRGDASKYGFHYHPQILRFFNGSESGVHEFNSLENCVFFSGVDKGRLVSVKEINQALKAIHVEFDCHLIKDKRKKYESQDLAMFSLDYISYEAYLIRARRATCLLEISQGDQDGLTTRALEAMFLNKKLLTKNKDIINYDFYHENNVYVLDHDKRSLENFFSIPLFPIKDEIKAQYTINHLLTSMSCI